MCRQTTMVIVRYYFRWSDLDSRKMWAYDECAWRLIQNMFPSHTKIKFPKSEKGYLEWQWIIWVCKPSLFLKEKETLPRMKRATLGGNESTKRVSHHFSIKKKKRKKKKEKRKREQEMSINEKLRGSRK